jgi:hypothetical protein
VSGDVLKASTNQAMLLIKSLDTNAHLGYSEWTGQWYVSARIDIGGDGVLRGGSEHRNTPDEAVSAYLSWLTDVDVDHYLVTSNPRRHWRWNGAAFAEQIHTYKEAQP